MMQSTEQYPVRDLIVIGTSSGGVQAVDELVRALPADLPAAVMVVLHVPAEHTSVLPEILNRAGTLSASHAKDMEAIELGRIYVAPPDRHLFVERGRVRVIRGPRENGHRPAVDALFRSAARAYGPQVIGVVLTGSLFDGTAGLRSIKERGGLSVIQDPSEAFAAGMPQSAAANVPIDHCVRLAAIAPLLARLVNERLDPAVLETLPPVENGRGVDHDSQRLYELSTHFSCPDCNGVLYELDDGLQYRCRVGHVYSPEALWGAQGDGVESALWAAVRSLEETATLARRLSKRFGPRQMSRFESRALEAEHHAAIVRRILTQGAVPTAEPAA